jgi:hypothetical protein
VAQDLRGVGCTAEKWEAPTNMNTESSSLNFPHKHAISRARFFLQRAEKCSVDEREAFEANLEAAIVFGRTALLRLKTKYGEKPGKHPDWDTWWDPLLTDPSVDFFRKARDFILKEGPPKIHQIILLAPLGDGNTDPPGFRGHTPRGRRLTPKCPCCRTLLFRKPTNPGDGNCSPSPAADNAACRRCRRTIPAMSTVHLSNAPLKAGAWPTLLSGLFRAPETRIAPVL